MQWSNSLSNYHCYHTTTYITLKLLFYSKPLIEAAQSRFAILKTWASTFQDSSYNIFYLFPFSTILEYPQIYCLSTQKKTKLLSKNFLTSPKI